MHLRVGLVGLDLGKNVRGGAGYDHDLGVIGLFEGGQHLVGVHPFHGAAVHAQVQRGGGMGRAGEQGEGQAGQRET